MQQPKLIGVCLSTLYDEDRFNFIKELNKYAVNNGFRLFVFNSGNDLYEQNNKTTKGAASIFSLIPYEKLSAIIVCPNFIHNEKIINNIIKKSHENSVPVISIDKEIEGCVAFSFTYADVFESLCRHVIEYHGVKRVNIITGLKGNDYSEERLAVFRKVLEENNIPFDEKNVGYGCFMPEQTSDVLKKWFETEKRELPEAIICANDIMAVTTSTFLQKKGFKIPDDCIVTGFDGIEQSRYHLPKLTTCRQDYDKMGRLIVEKILALENGETAEGSYRVGFKIKYSQSCGCKKVIDINVNLAIQTLIDRMRLSNERNSMMCSMQSEISKMSDIRELPQILIDKFRFHTTVLAINNDVFEAAESGLSREDESRFGKTVSILHQRYLWNEIENCEIPTAELLPKYELLLSHTEPIVVCTAHFIDMVLGYCVFQTDIDLDEYRKIYAFMCTIGTALGNFQSRIQMRSINEKLVQANKELYMLSQRDFMTGLFNRRGFFDNFSNLMAADRSDDSSVIVISADLDELKQINDNFGHHEGDDAIKTVGRALVSSSVHGEICSRFGGDEFSVAVIVPSQDADVYFDDFKSKFFDYLYDYNRKSDKPYKVNASIGCYADKVKYFNNLEEMIKIADERMYADKIFKKKQRH